MNTLNAVQSSRHRAQKSLHRQYFEALEQRLLFSVTTKWLGADQGDPTWWDVAANWTNGVPGPGDTAIFDGTGTYPDPPGMIWTHQSSPTVADMEVDTNMRLSVEDDILTVTGALTVNSGVFVVFYNGKIVADTVNVAADYSQAASLNVFNNAKVEATSALNIGTGENSTAALTIENGGTVEADAGAYSDFGQVHGNTCLIDVKPADGPIARGVLITRALFIAADDQGDGTAVEIEKGDNGTGQWQIEGDADVDPGVILSLAGEIRGMANLNARSGTFVNVGGGIIIGTGSLNENDNTGIFASGFIQPGTDPDDDPFGTFTIMGDLTLDASAAIDNVNLDAENDSNLLYVTGTATLGTLEGAVRAVNLDTGTDLVEGESFVFLTATSMSENFSDYGGGDGSPYWGEPLTPEQAGYLPALPVIPLSGSTWVTLVWEMERVQNTDLSYSLVLSIGYGDYGGYGGYDRAGTRFAFSTSVTAPTLFSASVVANHGLHLSWNDPNQNETGYEIQRKTDDGEWVTVDIAQTNVIGWLDTSVQHGYTYTYRVRALGDDDLHSDFIELSEGILY